MAGGLKTERGQYSAILNQQAWSMKDFLYGKKQNFFSWGTNAGNPERARWAHFARSGSQSESGIYFILPIRGFRSIIIRVNI